MAIEMEPFKDREHIVAEIRKCRIAAEVGSWSAILFVVLGIIADLYDWVIIFRTTTWLLLAIFAAVMAVMPHMHVVMAKHLLGTEIIKK